MPHTTLTQVDSLDTSELLEGGWREGCLLLVMPGGADLPYCKHLDGRGNSLIRGGLLALVLLTCRLGMLVAEAAAPLKLLERGVSKEALAMLVSLPACYRCGCRRRRRCPRSGRG